MKEKRLVILGSTGSIGRSTLDVVRRLGGFKVVGLASAGEVSLVTRQVREFRPKFIAVSDRASARELRRRLGRKTEVLEGPEGIAEAGARDGVDTVVSAIVGSAGLRPTWEAVRRGRTIALANKETLVAGGELISREAERSGAKIVPVDSEHSAIFQCLDGRDMAGVAKILLTGSGGPFRGMKSLEKVTVRDALRHPTWRMGPKITIDSATLMNKGLEVIEARWLFGLPESAIEVVIHPQSIIHSMVEFRDGSVMAQLGLPDMRLPILYSLVYPARVEAGLPRLDLKAARPLTFEAPDMRRFPCLGLARAAVRAGGTAPVVLNAANEIAVQAFLEGRLGFNAIPRLIEAALKARPRGRLGRVEDIIEVDRETRARSAALVALEARR